MKEYTLKEWHKESGLYTKEDVMILLEKQREECFKKAKIKCSQYNNPYSDSDGDMDYYIDKNSILNAKIEI